MRHFLVITEGFYDTSTVHGIFDNFSEARSWVENAPRYEYANHATIQEFDGPKRLSEWERNPLHKMDWRQR